MSEVCLHCLLSQDVAQLQAWLHQAKENKILLELEQMKILLLEEEHSQKLLLVSHSVS